MPSPNNSGFGGIAGITGWDPISQVGSGLLNQLLGGINARRQWRYQKKAMALQQKYALEQMQKQSDLNYQNWQNQFDYENEYNAPTKVRDRWAEAGASLAAVLGQSGVGVNATMSGGDVGGVSTPGTPGAQGASGIGPMPTSSGIALSEIQTNKSVIARNNAAAARDQAEADDINDRNLGRDFWQELGDLDKQLKQAGINDLESAVAYRDSLREWQDAANVYKDIIATYDMQRCIAEYSAAVSRANRMESENRAEIPLLEIKAAAVISAYLAAAAHDYAAAGNLDIQTQDLQNWFDVNWKSDVDIPEIDEDGKPTGKSVKMTGRDVYLYLKGAETAKAVQDLTGAGFDMWKRKHPLLYSITNSIASGASSAAGAYVGARTGGKGAPKGNIVINARNVPLKY